MGRNMIHDEAPLNYANRKEPRLDWNENPKHVNGEYPTWEEALDWSFTQGMNHQASKAQESKHWMNSSTISAAAKIIAAQLPVVLAYIASLFVDGDFVGWGMALTSAMTLWQVPKVISGRIKAGGIL